MTDTPERTTTEIPQTPDIPSEPGASSVVAQEMAPRPESYLEKLERHGAQVRADDFTQQVYNDSGQPLITPTPTNVITITVPANQEQLLTWAKGDPANSITWLAKFWIRMIKKAVKYGWHLVMPPPPTTPVGQVQGGVQQHV